MAYKRKRTTTTTNLYRARRMRKAGLRRSRMRLSNNQHNFKRTTQLANLATSSIAPGYRSYTFHLDQLPGVSDFTTLYDQYRINGVKLEFVPQISGMDGNPNTTLYAMPNIHMVIDRDDTNTLALTDMMQYTGYKRKRGHLSCSVYFKPSVLTEVFRSAVSTSYVPKTGQFIDMAAPNVPHYGVKVIVDQGPGSGIQWAWTVFATYYFTCKNVR